MKIKSGEYEVIFSGTVIGMKDEPIEFHFPKNHASLIIIIEFILKPEVKGSSIEFKVINDKSLKLFLINVESSIGSGNTNRLEIGHLENRKLYLNYRIFSINELSKTIHYTFYVGKKGSYV